MSETGLPWTDAQWGAIRQVVHDEALRSRVAGSFLPLYGPLPAATETVPKNELIYPGEDGGHLTVNDHDALRLANVSVNVERRSHMVADPELAAATILFRRAAEVIARVEDAIIFGGKKGDAPPIDPKQVPLIYTVGGAPEYKGLLDYHGALNCPTPDGESQGVAVFNRVVQAVMQLERNGYHRPYACVLAHDLFAAVNRPMPASMVLPRDSLPPFLEGPLLRSSCLPANKGLLISLQGEPVEIVVPADISVRFLQITAEGRYLFRVSQRFVLRVKDERAIVPFSVSGPSPSPSG
jgi:uncharacterized linocin/CFP29 family protein